jgi:hypothetical protein
MTPQVIPRVPLVSREHFIASWEKAGHPVIFTGAARDWPASSKWTFEWFRSTHGGVEITVRSALYTWGALPGTSEPLGGARRMKLATYLDEVEASSALPIESDLDELADKMLGKRPEEINHLVGPSLLRAVPSLREDVRFPDYAREPVEVAGERAGRGVPVIAITDNPLGPFARIADVSFEIGEPRNRPFRSLVAPICLAQSLVVALGHRLAVRQGGRNGRRR